ncbi:hypothetical protein LBMAG56_36410 [Verrucomicrobiota bacterium]|nr:hypothetical protein LBMAG56_36410 [Verrucomicrobiota bacterium]
MARTKKENASSSSTATIGKIVDDAIGGSAPAPNERDNPRLESVLPKAYARPDLDTEGWGEEAPQRFLPNFIRNRYQSQIASDRLLRLGLPST